MSRDWKKSLPSLSTNIIIGLLLGIVCGLVFGEYCAFLQIFGDAFIKLLQMSILPYIVVSLVTGIGRLSFTEAKLIGIKGGRLLLLFWAIGFAVILIISQAYPSQESASFFSTSLVEIKAKVDFLELYIPSNPFRSLANNVIPATVLFSIVVGIALIGIENKEKLIAPLSILSNALTRVAHFVVYLTPIGVFAIAASAAGTMTMEEFGRLQAYMITFIVAAALLTFWILPVLASTFTPFKYKDIVSFSKDALVTALTTGNLFIVLPILSKNCKDLLEKYKLQHKDSETFIDVLLPVSFTFPNIGKLLALLFILFAAWFNGNPLSIADYPNFIFSGLFSFFGSVDMALPFLLDTMHLPSDFFKLYIMTGIINGKIATLLAAMHMLIFTLLATCAITGFFAINWKKLFSTGIITVLLITVIVIGTRAFLSHSLTDAYNKDKVIAGMQLLRNPLPTIVHKTMPQDPAVFDSKQPRLERIRKSGILRVGYHAARMPFSFLNAKGDLVGFDIEMAHELAGDLGVKLEFIPFQLDTIEQQLKLDHFDIVMSGIPMLTFFLEDMSFSRSYLDATLALVVKDYRRGEFNRLDDIKNISDLKIGIVSTQTYAAKARELLPRAQVVALNSHYKFFEGAGGDLDALLISAEMGSAWTLVYPDYQVVVPKPNIHKLPMGYPIAGNDQAMINFMNHWVELKKKDKTIDRLYNYWILGKGAKLQRPRWSIIRNVLHWVD